MNKATDTIAAIATPPGQGGIGILRMSGADAVKILRQVFDTKSKTYPTHRMLYGYIYKNNRAERLDEVLCVVMRAPHSYTKEDVVEIHGHGGAAVIHGILELLLQKGARLAEPGEFTKRAFLNGRLDLAQAEAVMTLIGAKTEYGRRVGLQTLTGGLSQKINRFRDTLLTWLAHIELSIDYPEHATEAMNLATIYAGGETLLAEIRALSATARAGRAITEGVKAVITGRPNAGKSSLLNAMLRQERAIVTEIPGTTRDIVSETLNINGVPVILLDTAGIRETEDIIEKIGVDKSAEQLQNAALILWVIDSTAPLQKEDRMILTLLEARKDTEKQDTNIIILLNKCDLPAAPDNPLNGFSACQSTTEAQSLLQRIQALGTLMRISAKNADGLEKVYQAIEQKYVTGVVTAQDEIITQVRHSQLLAQAETHVQQALSAIAAGMPEDLISIDLTMAYTVLGEIIGQAVGEDVLERIFSTFCVGK